MQSTQPPNQTTHPSARSKVQPSVRCNIVVALGDLASRWPNALEPWTW